MTLCSHPIQNQLRSRASVPRSGWLTSGSPHVTQHWSLPKMSPSEALWMGCQQVFCFGYTCAHVGLVWTWNVFNFYNATNNWICTKGLQFIFPSQMWKVSIVVTKLFVMEVVVWCFQSFETHSVTLSANFGSMFLWFI